MVLEELPGAVVEDPGEPGAGELLVEVEPGLVELELPGPAALGLLDALGEGVSVGLGQGTIVEFGFAGFVPCEPAPGTVDWGVLLGVCDEVCPDGFVGLGVADVCGLVGGVGGVVAPVGGFTLGVEVCPA